MDRMVLEAKIRPPLTRGELNQLRREGKVPAVIYGRGKDTQSLLVDGRLLGKVLSMGGPTSSSIYRLRTVPDQIKKR